MEETLLTAARRAVRFFRIDMDKGGIITVQTQHAIETLDKQVLIEAERQKSADPQAEAGTIG